MKDYKLIVFDLDGTLMDTSEGIISAVKYTIDYFGLHELTEKTLATFIGPPIQDSFSKTYGLDGPILQEIATVFRERYKNVDLLLAKPYPGIFDTLTKLKKAGKALAVATYKREDYAIELLRYYGFEPFFSIMHGGDHENKLKKADIIRLCINETSGASKNNCLLVGDTVNDSLGAEMSGIDFLGVCYGFGFRSREEVMKYRSIGAAESPEELARFCLCPED